MSACLVDADGNPRRGAAIVTGASRGIGLAIAAALVERGLRVTITGRDEAALKEAAAQLGTADDVLPVPGSTADADHRAAAVAATVERFGAVDVLVNNTGINPLFGPLVEADLDRVRKILDVNVVAALAWTQEAHRASMRDHGGAVVNIASVVGLGATRWLGAYAMSKAAMIHLTEQLARELAPSIRVNAIAPALVHTRFAAPLYERDEQAVLEDYPLGRLGAPEDVAAAVAFLASDEASWITGQTLVADGGLTLTAFDGMGAQV